MVHISDQGKEIVRLCEEKVALQNDAEALSEQTKQLIIQLKMISDKQHDILLAMKNIDNKIEHLCDKL